MPFDDTIFLKSKVDVLSFFNEDQLRRITPDIERNVYAKGDVLILRGEVTSGFYIVKKGRVAALMKPKTGEPVTVQLAAGEFFGEVSMLENTASAASVKAVEDDTEGLTIPPGSFHKLLEMQPLLKQTLLQKAAQTKKPV